MTRFLINDVILPLDAMQCDDSGGLLLWYVVTFLLEEMKSPSDLIALKFEALFT